MSKQVNESYKFGSFQIDARERLLSREGEAIALTPKAFDTLLVLVRNSGHLMLKDELMKAVWPDSFVEEVNLSQNVSALRRALGDTAQASRYIATVPGKGYRFIAEVEADQPSVDVQSTLVVEQHSQSEIVIEQSSSQRVRALLAGLMLVLVVVALGAYRLRKADQAKTFASSIKLRRSIAVLPFQNLSGRPEPAWLSTGFSEMLGTELAAGEQLRLVSSEEVALLRTNLPISTSATLSKGTLAQIRQVIGADLVVLGSYSDLGRESGGKIRLDLRLQDTAAGETIASISETGTEAGVFQLVSTAGADLRTRLGVPAVSEGDAVTARALLPANAEAARLYAEGLAKLRVFDAVGGRDMLVRAIQADPKYALAHSALSEAWSTLGYEQKALDEANQAFQLSGNLARRDRLFIEARYRAMNKQWDRALELYHTLFNFFPDDIEYGLRLAETQTQAHKNNDALETIQVLRKLPPPSGNDVRIDLAQEHTYYQAGQYKMAEQPAARSVEKAKAQGVPLLLAITLAKQADILAIIGEGEKATVAAQQARTIYAAAGDRFGVAKTLNAIGTALYYKGRYGECEKAIQEALEINRSIGNKGGAAEDLRYVANLRGARGDVEGAKKSYEEALAVEREIGNRFGEAGALLDISWAAQSQGLLTASVNLSEQALAIYRDLSDEGGIAHTLAHEGNVLTDVGDLDKAKQVSEQALALLRKTGNRNVAGLTLYGLGNIASFQAKPDEAKRAYAEALSIGQTTKDAPLVGRAKLGLASIAADEGHFADARKQATELLEGHEQPNDPPLASSVQNLLAEVTLDEGNIQEARQILRSMEERLRQDQVAYPNFAYRITNARFSLATGNLSEARRSLNNVIAEATKQGQVYFQFEARLALCELEAKTNRAGARVHSQALAKDARRKGFEQIARKALAVGS